MEKDIFFASFIFLDNLYELFFNPNEGFKVKVVSKNNNRDKFIDAKLAKIIINKIIKSSKIPYDVIKNNNSIFNVYYNEIEDTFSFAKNEKDHLIPCTDEELIILNSIYNNPIYNLNIIDNQPSIFDNVDELDNDLEESRLEEQRKRRLERQKKEKKKKIIITIGSITIVITILVSSLAIVLNKLKSKNYNITDTEISEVTNVDKDVEELIRESLEGEEPWVVESIIKQYEENNYGKTQPAISLDNRSKELIKLIKHNKYIEDKDKQTLINNFSGFFNSYSKCFTEDAYEDICEKIKTLKIERKIAPKESLSISGQYASGENIIMLYQEDESTLTHEFVHMLGGYVVLAPSGKRLVDEGMTEMLNPLRNVDIYSAESVFAVILCEIYGKDFMLESFFSPSGLYSCFNDKFNDSFESHWDFVYRDISPFLQDMQNKNVKDFSSDEESKAKTMAIIEKIKSEYENVNQRSWEDSSVLKACFDIMLQTNTLGLPQETSVYTVYVNADEIGFTQTKEVMVSYEPEDEEGYIWYQYESAYGDVDLSNKRLS